MRFTAISSKVADSWKLNIPEAKASTGYIVSSKLKWALYSHPLFSGFWGFIVLYRYMAIYRKCRTTETESHEMLFSS